MKFLDSTGVSYLMGLIKTALSGYKPKQDAVSDPTASGTSTTFIATASQDANGKMTLTKKSVPTVAASSGGTGGNDGMMTAAQAEKLAGIQAGATKVESSSTNGKIKINGNETTVYTHPSGTNPHGTTKSDVGLGNVTNDAQVKASEKGVANGVATLDANGLVPSSQLPSYVDDVIEMVSMKSTAPTTCSKGDIYYNTSSKKLFTATAANTWGSTGATPETGKIYVDKESNKTYRWGGTDMAVISETLAVGTTTGTAADGKVVNDHIADTTSHITSSERSEWNAKVGLVGALGDGEIAVGDDNGNVQGSGKTVDDLALVGHVHGNITNDGKLQTSDVAVANGDKLVIADSSDSGKVARASVSFDGSTTNKALTPKGTFENFLQTHQDISGKADKSATVSTVSYDTTNKKITKTINGSTTDVVTASTIVTDGGGIKAHQTIVQDGITGASINRYASCSTAAATAAKEATIGAGTPDLAAGLHVFVKFTNKNTAESPTLNINNKGAKAIWYDGAAIASDASIYGLLEGVCEFVYDGTQWHLIGKKAALSTSDLDTLWAAASAA